MTKNMTTGGLAALVSSLLPPPLPPFTPSPLAADPDPNLDANSFALAWENQAAAPVLASPFFSPSNATMGVSSSRAVDALSALSPFLTTTSTPRTGVMSLLSLSPARAGAPDW